MKIIGRDIVFTADDEMPDCMECDLCDYCDNGKYCGPEYGWARYKRTERVETVKMWLEAEVEE